MEIESEAPDRHLSVIIGLLEAVVDDKAMPFEMRTDAATLSIWFCDHAAEFNDAPERAVSVPGAAKLLQHGLDLLDAKHRGSPRSDRWVAVEDIRRLVFLETPSKSNARYVTKKGDVIEL